MAETSSTTNGGKYIPPFRRKSESENDNKNVNVASGSGVGTFGSHNGDMERVNCKPSSCHCHDWIWAFNETDYNNRESTDKNGKWMIFCHNSVADTVWSKIAINTEQGNLGSTSKISTMNKDVGETDDHHVICVFTYDYTDEKDVMRVRQYLRKLGFIKPIGYKSDADTLAGVYRKNGFTNFCKYRC